MRSSELALVQGIDVTRATLRRWNAAPSRAVVPWVLGSLGIALALLAGVWLIARLVTPDSPRLLLPGLNQPGGLEAVGQVIFRNALVLTLHAMACVAGFIARSSLPLQAEQHRGVSRWIHDHAGSAAVAFVGAATLFSLATQAYVLGSTASTLSNQLAISPALLLLTLLPHALPELVALFLPLAAWLVASRRGRWDELLAATIATTLLAVPVVLLAANVEVFVWPHLLRAVSPVV